MAVPYPVASGSSIANSNTLVLTAGTLQVGSGATGTAAGDAIIVGASLNNATGSGPTGVTDSKSNTYVRAVSLSGNGYDSSIWVAVNATALVSGTDTITITYTSTSTTDKNAAAVGFTGLGTTATVDAAVSAFNNTGSTAPSVSTGTLAQPSELIIGWSDSGAGSGGITWSAPVTRIMSSFQGPSSNQWSGMSYDVVSSTSAVTVAGTITSARWSVLAISLKLPLPVVTTASLPGGTEGIAYSQAVAATGGFGAYTWSISAGSLPTGLSLSSGGLITGTPTATGTFTFTAEVTDANSNTGTAALAIAIAQPGSSVMQPPAGHGWFAAYPGSGNADPNAGGTTSYESPSMANRQLAAWYRYYEVTQAVPTADDRSLVAAGRFLVMSLASSFAVPPAAGGITYASVAAGTYDSYLGAIGSGIAALAQPCWVVWGHEMELSQNAGFGTATQFIASFQHVANILRAAAPGNVIMVWVCSNASLTNTACAPYYPGDAYVDWIGADPYDQSLSKGSPSAAYTPFTQFLNSNPLSPAGGAGSGGGLGKPIGIFETGVDQPPANTDANVATWINKVPAALSSLGYQYWAWFNASGTLGDVVIVPGSLSAGALATIGASSFFNPPSVLPSTTPYPVGSASSATGSATLVIPVAATTNLNDGLVVAASVNNNAGVLPSSCADSQGNTYTRAANTSTSQYGSAMFTATSASVLTAGTDTITVTYSSAVSAGRTAAAVGIPGAKTSGAVDVAVSAVSAGSTTPSAGTGVLAQGAEVVVAFTASGAGSGAISWGAGMTPQVPGFQAPSSNQWSSMATQVTSSNAGVTVSGTITSARWTILALSVRLASLPVITTASLPGATTGVAYSQPLTVSGGISPYTWSVSAGSLPAGLTLNASTGVISGTPPDTGTSSFTIEVTDSASNAGTRALSIVVASNLEVTTTTLPAATTGVAYSQTFEAAGGTTPYTWTISTGSLPAGLSLNGVTGVVSGTAATGGTSSFTAEVTDAGSNTATQPLSITVASSLTVTTTTLPAGRVGVAYSQTLAATGGSGAYTWSHTGSLPGGLSLSSGGAITGSPAGTGAFPFTVTVTDAGSNTASASLSITILAAIITGTWSGSYSRDPLLYSPGPPALAPLEVPVANTAGGWLFALVSWRQDDSTPAGQIAYASSTAICDDAGNFWIPVSSGVPRTGVLRCAVWMAPAARPAQFVFASPTAWQAAITVLIVEVAAVCPWYQVAAQASAFTSQGTSITQSQDPAAGVFSIGMIACDVAAATVSTTATGWTALTTLDTTNPADGSGDLVQLSWYMTSAGSTGTISASSGTTMDWAEVIIAVRGVTDLLDFPYPLPLENWPVLVTEMASGPVLNADPVFALGAADWTAANAAITAVTWPLYTPWPAYGTYLSGSLQVTPSGSATSGKAQSGREPVSPVVLYTMLAYVYSAAGYPGGTVAVFTDWFTSGGSPISTTTGPAEPLMTGEWQQLTPEAPFFPPATAGLGSTGVVITANTGDVPSTAVYYLGYCALGVADSYEGTPPDEVWWTDFSARNYTLESAQWERGIQYEQQSLEAGTFSASLQNSDAALTFGNILSTYWPNAGDTDVQVRFRAVWPGSLTPYYPLFSGFTDQIEFGWDDDWYAFCKITASDTWSRLTQQLLGCIAQEVLQDSPLIYIPCSQSGADIASGATTAAAPAAGALGPGTGTSATFTSSVISVPGDQGTACWQVQQNTNGGFQGTALGIFPAAGSTSLPPVSNGMTVEFWFTAQAVSASQTTGPLVLCTCWTRRGPMWTLWVDNSDGSGHSTCYITVYDKSSGAGTATQVGLTQFLNATAAPLTWMAAVTFTQTSLTVVINPGGPHTENVTVSCSLTAYPTGLSFGGNIGPYYATVTSVAIPITTLGFWDNFAVYGIVVTPGLLSAARLASHYQAGATAFASELDTWRLARIAGYSGFVPVLAMRCLGLAVPPGPDLDIVTAATDTTSQIVSAYFTNIAASTLAAMFTDGAGALVYRRRLEWYDRPLPQWVTGELAPVPLNSNVLNAGPSAAPWAGQNGAALTTGSATANALFYPYAALFSGNGVTASPQIAYGPSGGCPVTAGGWYSFSSWLYSPQGWTQGMSVTIGWYTSGLSLISSESSATSALGAGSLLWLTTGPVQAPATAAIAALTIAAAGTPPGTTGFYAAAAVMTAVGTVTAGGAGATAPEAPYLPDVKISSDRAQLYNQAVLTQYGTNLISTFTGSSVLFGPSSGIIVQVTNQPSVTSRGAVPYTATLYTDNTVQALPYYLDQPSMEDFGNWVTQTLGAPLMRPETVTLTPAATPPALTTGLQAEIGDTTTFRRRPVGLPEIQILTYDSKMTHDVNRESGEWTARYELSPFSQGTVLACDDVIHGTLTGGNLLPF